MEKSGNYFLVTLDHHHPCSKLGVATKVWLLMHLVHQSPLDLNCSFGYGKIREQSGDFVFYILWQQCTSQRGILCNSGESDFEIFSGASPLSPRSFSIPLVF